MSDFLGLEEVNPGEGVPVLENIETIGYFTELFRADYEGMTEGDINTMMEAYLYGGEFVHESHHPFGNFISGILDVTIVKPLIECIIGKDLITGDKLTEFEQAVPEHILPNLQRYRTACQQTCYKCYPGRHPKLVTYISCRIRRCIRHCIHRPYL